MIAAAGSGELLAGVLSSLVVVIAALAIALSRIGSRVARLEEWVRVAERRRNGELR